MSRLIIGTLLLLSLLHSQDINITNNIPLTPPPSKESKTPKPIAEPSSSIGIPDGNCPYGDRDCNIEYIRNVVGRR